jgi:hypothetical protein
MKKLFIGLCFMFGAAVVANAQDTTSVQSTDTVALEESNQYRIDDMEADDKDRKEISVSELPTVITDKLQSADYSGWTVGKVYSKEKNGETMYKVELKQGDETKKVKFDAQGNVIPEN